MSKEKLRCLPSNKMIKKCDPADFDSILAVINDGAQAYRGVIPPDRWKEPYMESSYLRHEIEAGVQFWGEHDNGAWTGVMGIQYFPDVTLIRHAYVCSKKRREGIGGRILDFLYRQKDLPVLVGTWAAASWAIRFYEKHGFRLVSYEEKERLLRKYWNIPLRQIETSVVLADGRWFEREGSR